MDPPNLFIPLFEAFSWFETGLQAYMREAGWPEVTRPQTMVLITITRGARRPAEIARRLNITRQSVGKTIAEMLELGLVVLDEDPNDRRAKVVSISELGHQRHRDSRDAVRAMTEELSRRIGDQRVANLIDVMEQDWGEAIQSFAGKARPGRAEPPA